MKYKFEPKVIVGALTLKDKDINAVAKQAKISPNTIWRAVRGEPLRFRTYVRLCSVLDLDPQFEEETF